MTPFHQIAMPAQDGVRPDEEPQLAQGLPGSEVRSAAVLRRESHSGVSAGLAFKDGDLVAQGKNLHVLVPIAHV
ncbi:hypothetical protein ABT120_40505 [Nonomuraea angiospora]|uniref:hypothetical protein n=1 Tax=Nonomuraea angiospora TaxID=46172 RepID=UPI00332F2022